MEFEGDHVTLRPFVLTDAEGLARIASDRKVKAALLISHPFTVDDAIAFIESADSSVDSEVYAITFDGIVIGAVGFERISDEHNNARLYAWIGSDYASGPYLTDAIGLALHHAFRDLKLHKVYARVLSDDEFTRKQLRSFGFRSEGKLHEHVMVRRRYHDVNLYALLKDEYKR